VPSKQRAWKMRLCKLAAGLTEAGRQLRLRVAFEEPARARGARAAHEARGLGTLRFCCAVLFVHGDSTLDSGGK
jgi:hypothetical protein